MVINFTERKINFQDNKLEPKLTSVFEKNASTMKLNTVYRAIQDFAYRDSNIIKTIKN